MDTDVHEVERYVDAAPIEVYRLVSDVERMGEWSPETVRCEWRDGATGPAVGARFKAWNRRGWVRWSNSPVVIAADEGREFAFDRRAMGYSVVWRYTMTPVGAGTELRESYQLQRAAPAWAEWLVARLLRTSDRHRQLEEDMRITLERIAAAVEATGGGA